MFEVDGALRIDGRECGENILLTRPDRLLISHSLRPATKPAEAFRPLVCVASVPKL